MQLSKVRSAAEQCESQKLYNKNRM